MRKTTPATMRDVAKLAGVGTTTVSRVINGGDRVKAATLARVQEAVTHLGFQPNHAARILKGESTKTIGVIVPSIADGFFATVASAAQEVARSFGYVAILGASGSDCKTEESQVEVLTRHRVEGLLIAASFPNNPQLLSLLKSLHAPVVAFDRPLNGTAFPYVVVDNRQGARRAVNHMIEHGHKRIACFPSSRELFTTRQRIKGYRDAIRRAGLPEMISEEGLSMEAVHRSLSEMLDSANPPTALFGTKNQVTTFLFSSLRRLGYSIPRDVALIGFDDFDSAEFMSPAVSVISQPVVKIGMFAAQGVFDRIERRSMAKHGAIVLPTELRLRESCGCERTSAPSL